MQTNSIKAIVIPKARKEARFMARGYSDVLIGLQFGDEAKGKITDIIANEYDVIGRFNGGPNAGHTIYNGNIKLVLHQIPSAVFHSDKILYIGSGCVINLEKLVEEIKDVNRCGIDLHGRLHISDQVSIIQPHHVIIDGITGVKIGTTKNGIGPAYADKALRITNDSFLNVRLGDLVADPKRFLEDIKTNLIRTIRAYKIEDVEVDKTMEGFKEALSQILVYVQKDTLFLHRIVEKGGKVLYEGAQSFMLDITKGCVPYVTSSNTLASAAYIGGDLPPKYHRKTIGVAKAIMSRVGYGPFVSEFGGLQSEEYCMEQGGMAHTKKIESALNVSELLRSDNLFDIGIALRILGNDYGATTKRPRRTGMLDLVQLEYAIKMNAVDELYLNKCDLLNVFSSTKLSGIPVVVGYKLDDQEIDYSPTSLSEHKRVVPIIEYFEHFSEDISGETNIENLPTQLKRMLELIEDKLSCSIVSIGTSPMKDGRVKLVP